MLKTSRPRSLSRSCQVQKSVRNDWKRLTVESSKSLHSQVYLNAGENYSCKSFPERIFVFLSVILQCGEVGRDKSPYYLQPAAAKWDSSEGIPWRSPGNKCEYFHYLFYLLVSPTSQHIFFFYLPLNVQSALKSVFHFILNTSRIKYGLVLSLPLYR